MPILELLPLIFSAVGALNAGYTFLSNVERDHPGSVLTQDHLDKLKELDTKVYSICNDAFASINRGERDLTYGA